MRRCAAGQGLGQGSVLVNPSCAALRSGMRSSQQGLAASSRMRTQIQFVVAQQLPIYVPPCSTASRCTALILFGFPRAVNSNKCKSPNLSKDAYCCRWQRALKLICVCWAMKHNPKRHELFPPSFDSPQTAATAWQAAHVGTHQRCPLPWLWRRELLELLRNAAFGSVLFYTQLTRSRLDRFTTARQQHGRARSSTHVPQTGLNPN